jgi:hypothetical protein
MARGMLIVLILVGSQIKSQESPRHNVLPHLCLMGFTLGKSTIPDVQRKLGASTVGRCSDEQDASNEICYVLPGPQEDRVFFESGVSGGWSGLDGFRVVSGTEKSTCRVQCASATGAGNIQTNGGLKLGLKRNEVLNLLGSPTRETGDSLTFEWLSRKRMTKDEMEKSGQNPVTYPYWNVLDTIQVTLRNSKVVEFEVSHTVTD